MAGQVTNGKAFEWVVGLVLSEHDIKLIKNAASAINEAYYKQISEEVATVYLKNARLAMQHILFKENITKGSFVFLNDSHGIGGDVRDIIINCEGREIGISCKTNHSAYKHSRLSDKVNFLQKWNLDSNGCSQDYLQKVKVIFEKLRKIKTGSKSTAKWSDQPDVPNDYYWPVLDAFSDEIKRVSSPIMCENFIRYLIGKHDFYKVISRKGRVEIQGFNINGTLNIPKIPLPNKILDCQNKNGSQYSKTIWFNSGWTFNFRIHNASSRIEPSLKFDITATGLPPKLYQHHISD